MGTVCMHSFGEWLQLQTDFICLQTGASTCVYHGDTLTLNLIAKDIHTLLYED